MFYIGQGIISMIVLLHYAIILALITLGTFLGLWNVALHMKFMKKMIIFLSFYFFIESLFGRILTRDLQFGYILRKMLNGDL